MAGKERLILHLKKQIFQNHLLCLKKPLGTGQSARVKVLKWTFILLVSQLLRYQKITLVKGEGISQYIVAEIICPHFPPQSIGDVPKLLFELLFVIVVHVFLKY